MRRVALALFSDGSETAADRHIERENGMAVTDWLHPKNAVRGGIAEQLCRGWQNHRCTRQASGEKAAKSSSQEETEGLLETPCLLSTRCIDPLPKQQMKITTRKLTNEKPNIRKQWAKGKRTNINHSHISLLSYEICAVSVLFLWRKLP